MSPDEGWIKLHRKVTSSACWEYSCEMRSVWITILLKANHKQAWWRGHHIDPGQFATSRDHLARDSRTTVSQARTCLRHLSDWGQIKVENIANQLTKITVCNWAAYQEVSPAKSPAVSQPLANDTPTVSHKQECKNEENEKNEKKSPPLPPKGGEAVRSFKQWTREELVNEVSMVNAGLLTALEMDDFVAYWMEPTASGRSRMSLQKTWDTHRRMLTALRVVFEKQRQQRGGVTEKPATMFELKSRLEALQSQHKAAEHSKPEIAQEIRRKIREVTNRIATFGEPRNVPY